MVVYNYLSVIRKSDFIDLYKFGHLQVSQAITFDGDIESHSNDDYLFDLVTCKMNIFEYSFEYLLIHFTSEQYKGASVNVEIENVQGIYTFSQEAKKEMSISFDPRIQLYVSPWTDKFDKLQHDMFVRQSMRGIDNVWRIFDLSAEDKLKCEHIINNDIVSEVFREVFSYERPRGNKSIWTYLLRYERHSIYPRDMKGFFCDTIHVFCNKKSEQELLGEVAEQTDLYTQLMGCPKSDFKPLSIIALNSRLSQLTEEETGCRFVVAAPLFLFMKDKFKDGLGYKPSNDFINYAKAVGGFECCLAAYMLGLTLGYDNTYDGYYESINLPIFKNKLSDAKEPVQEVTDQTLALTPDESLSNRLSPGTKIDDVVVNTEGVIGKEKVLKYVNKITSVDDEHVKVEHEQSALSSEMKEPLAYLYKGRGTTYKKIIVYTEEDRKYYMEKEHYKQYKNLPKKRK